MQDSFEKFWYSHGCLGHNKMWKEIKKARLEFPNENWLFKINSKRIRQWIPELRKKQKIHEIKLNEIFVSVDEMPLNESLQIIKPNYKKEIVIITAGCIHIPKHDQEAVNCLLEISDYIKPDIGVLLGDIKDNPYYSKHNTAVSVLIEDARRGKKETKEFLKTFYGKCKEGKFIRGNHEAWIDLSKEQDPYALEDEDFTVPKIIGFDNLDVEYYSDCFEYENFVFRHGTCISSNADTAAKNEFFKELKSGCSAHLHRTGRYRHTSRTKEYSWHIVGTLAQKKMWYDLKGKNRDNSGWNQSIIIYRFFGNRFEAEPIDIFNGGCIYNGKTFGNTK